MNHFRSKTEERDQHNAHIDFINIDPDFVQKDIIIVDIYKYPGNIVPKSHWK